MGCVDNIRIQVTREALEKRAFRSLKVLYRGSLGPLGGMHVKLRTLARVASLTIYREVAPDQTVSSVTCHPHFPYKLARFVCPPAINGSGDRSIFVVFLFSEINLWYLQLTCQDLGFCIFNGFLDIFWDLILPCWTVCKGDRFIC